MIRIFLNISLKYKQTINTSVPIIHKLNMRVNKFKKINRNGLIKTNSLPRIVRMRCVCLCMGEGDSETVRLCVCVRRWRLTTEFF